MKCAARTRRIPISSGSSCDRNGKLILWHGWADGGAPPEPTLDYYDDVVATTFGGDLAKARERARLFMFPGMGHCSGGPGPDTWDPLAPLVAWVENGAAPDSVVAPHATDGRVDDPWKSPKGQRAARLRPSASRALLGPGRRRERPRQLGARTSAVGSLAREAVPRCAGAFIASGSCTAVPDSALRWIASVHSM